MKHALATIELAEDHRIHWNDDIVQERLTAVSDLLEHNRFIVLNAPNSGPYHLRLGLVEGRVQLDIHSIEGQQLEDMRLPLSPFRGLIKEYFAVCEAYFAARKSRHPGHLEVIDMGRRGLHDDGASLLQERLAERIELDHDTARRLFTLICVLNLREIAR